MDVTWDRDRLQNKFGFSSFLVGRTSKSRDLLEAVSYRDNEKYELLYPSNFYSKIDAQISILSLLNRLFVVTNMRLVLDFVQSNRFLVPLLLQCREKVIEFIPDGKISLTLVDESGEYDSVYLVGVIETDMPLSQRFIVQDRIREEWWLDVLPLTRGKFHIEL